MFPCNTKVSLLLCVFTTHFVFFKSVFSILQMVKIKEEFLPVLSPSDDKNKKEFLPAFISLPQSVKIKNNSYQLLVFFSREKIFFWRAFGL
jgi:hypothetical protein